MTSLLLLPDVNLFLQCKDLHTLPWKEISETKTIVLVISRTVQNEIDRLKGDGNSRRAQKARETNSLFKKLMQAPEETLEVFSANPNVLLRFIPLLDPSRSKPSSLDLSKPDDCFVEEALALKNAQLADEVAILSHDIGPLRTAKHVGIQSILIPDTWLLGVGKDESQRKIDELTRQNASLQAQFPKVSISVEGSNNTIINKAQCEIVEFENPRPALIESVLGEWLERYPLKEDFSKPSDSDFSADAIYKQFMNSMKKYEPPSSYEIEKYRESYYKWKNDAEKFLKSIPERQSERNAVYDFHVKIENNGTKPAVAVLVEFWATKGFLIRPKPGDEDAVQDDEFPLPPDAPEGTFVNPFDQLSGQLSQMSKILGAQRFDGSFLSDLAYHAPLRKPRDPNDFYYRDGRPEQFVERYSLTCEQFRHQLEPEYFFVQVRCDRQDRVESGAIKCRLSAENLPNPVEFVFPIRASYLQGNSDGLLERYRPRKLRFE